MTKYVGARYMPKFMGTYNASTEYEALSVVDNGMGTSYVSNKPVPAGTPLTNKEYWSVYGATSGAILNLQNQINDMKNGDVSGSLQNQINDMKNGDVSGSLQNQIDDIVETITKLKSRYNEISLAIFKNKTVCIIGDSISDEATYNPNWVDAFTEIVESVGATVTNASITGSSIVGWGNEPTEIPTGYDIYIFALGVNDFQGQFNMSSIRSAASTIANRIDLSNANRKAFYVSPIKMFRTKANLGYFTTPLDVYRNAFEVMFNELGFSVISGSNVPNLSILTQSTYLADTLHPASLFRYIFAEHVIDAMISGVSENSFFKNFQVSLEGLPSGATGSITLIWDSPTMYRMLFNLLNANLTGSTWVDVANVTGLVDSYNMYDTFTDANGNTFQVRVNNNKVQVAARTTDTFNISGVAMGSLFIEDSYN